MLLLGKEFLEYLYPKEIIIFRFVSRIQWRRISFVANIEYDDCALSISDGFSNVYYIRARSFRTYLPIEKHIAH